MTTDMDKQERLARELQLARQAAARARRTAIIAGVVGVVTIISAIAFAVVASNTAQHVSNIRLEIDRFGILAAGDVLVPLLTQTPDIFIPTLTGVAALNAFTPTVQPYRFNGFAVPMVYVPAGCFFMGSDRGSSTEHPSHEQCFDQSQTFWIDQFEVTNEQYARFIQDGGYQAVEW